MRSGFFSAKRGVFATMMAEFQHETVLGFWPVRKLAFRRKAGRTGRQTEGLSHHEWGFCGFLSSKEVLRTSYFAPRLLPVIVAGALDERLRSHLAAHAVLDGDSLHGSGSRQGDGFTIQGAGARGCAAVGGVVDLRAVRTAHRHLSALSERGVTADGGCCEGGLIVLITRSTRITLITLRILRI